jgi:surface polysaccharide O-acyltransferase-like enzyme
MALVVLTHLQDFGGVIKSVDLFSINWGITQLLEVVTRYGVDVFILITGFLMVGKKFKFERLISLLTQVWFYAIVISIVIYIVKSGDVSNKELLKNLVPFFFKYWYIDAYIILTLFGPIINSALDNIDKRLLGITLIILVSTLSIGSLATDLFVVKNGHSSLWMLALYMVGWFIGKYVDVNKINGKKAWCVLALATVGTWLLNFGYTFALHIVKHQTVYISSQRFNSYTAPLIVIASIALLLIGINWKIKESFVLKWLAKNSFAVYVIHVAAISLIAGSTVWLGHADPIVLVAVLVVYVVGIYLACAIIETIRVAVVRRLKIAKWNGVIADVITSTISRVYNLITPVLK